MYRYINNVKYLTHRLLTNNHKAMNIIIQCLLLYNVSVFMYCVWCMLPAGMRQTDSIVYNVIMCDCKQLIYNMRQV